MVAPIGNDYNKKWKTSKERQDAFKRVCEHIESGYAKGSFPDADWDTVEAYMKEYPQDFPSEKLKESVRKGYLVWDKIGMEGTQGKLQGFNATGWIFNMKNRFKDDWRDKVEQEQSGTVKHEHEVVGLSETLEFLKRNTSSDS